MTKKNIDKEYQQEIEKSIKMFDVAKPDSSRPASTSRPVIVGHKAAISDPMVNKELSVKKTKKVIHAPKPKKIVIEHHAEVVIEPEPVKSVKEVVEPPVDEPVAEKNTAKKPDPKLKPIPTEELTPVADQEQKSEGESIHSGVVDTLAEQVADKKQSEKELKDVEIRIEEIQRSIDSKEFFLPIVTSEQKRNMRLVVTVLALIIVAGGAAFVFGPEREKINSLLNLK